MAINGRNWDAGIPASYGAYTLRLNVAEDINAGSNYSIVYWSMEIIETSEGNSWHGDVNCPWGVTINGTNWGDYINYDFRGGSNYKYVGDGNVVVYHNDNGDKAVNVQASFNGNSPLGYTDIGSQTYTLTDFDRKPAAPSTVSISIGADKSVTVSSNAVSSPASAANYFIQIASSTDGSTWSAWSGEYTIPSQGRFVTYAAGSLTYGLYYKFRMRAGNSDGYSAYTESNNPSSIFLPAGGRRFDGSTFNPTTIAKRHNGTDFVTLTIAKRHNGTSFVDLT